MGGAREKDHSRTDRRCHGCSACCVYLPMPAGQMWGVGKPAGVACPYRGRVGCRIYSVRPDLCRRFRCVWLKNPRWPVPWRPDRSGLLCLSERLSARLGVTGLVYEIRRGALGARAGREILARLQLQTQGPVVIVRADGNRYRLPGDFPGVWEGGLGESRRAA